MSERIEDFGVPVWTLLLCLLFCWLLVFLVLIKGISSLGKVRTTPSFTGFHRYELAHHSIDFSQSCRNRGPE